ncbi:hypothetical protein KAM329D_37760 [Aeromonas caviae]|nr:hypothetical protein KAM329_47400 [Aeromonas caviae]GJA15543.1 hypothetical protein KAM335_27390 [Aeromonas caviae]GJA25354.1 hypothetical protein KAM337_38820 [Aeromonas caviae]GJC24795.1 hypothetical protein KAM329D_37760 [Aeromonas caviae]
MLDMQANIKRRMHILFNAPEVNASTLEKLNAITNAKTGNEILPISNKNGSVPLNKYLLM